MPHTLDMILPSLESLGVLAYWIIGLASALEAFFVTGVFVPGTLAVDAGGILVQQGALGFFDLTWFVAIGSVLGAEAGYWTGRLMRRGVVGRWRIEQSGAYARAERLFARRGGLALVIGRFLGPVAGLVPLAAAVAGMDRRRFLLWNIIASVPYALAHLALGYFLGDVLARFGQVSTRVALFAAAFVAALALLWWFVLRLQRLLPFVLSVGRSVLRAVAENPDVAAWSARHPNLARGLARRLDTARFGGLPASFLALVFAYILVIWLGSVFDFLTADPIVQADQRIANLVHSFWTPTLLRVFAHITALGDWRVVLPMFVAALVWLLVHRRDGLALGLGLGVAGDLLSVAALKAIFHRPRPDLAYFAEATNSFPSGHAAISVAFWGMLFYAAWRTKRLGLVTASLGATALAFAIGFSRIFLIEHYMTDVANGWLVGGLWLVVAIAVTEWRAAAVPLGHPLALGLRHRAGALVGAVLLVSFAGWNVATYAKALNIPLETAQVRPVSDLAAMLADPGMATTTESVMGTPLEPVNVLIIARDEARLAAAMQAAGWLPAQPPSLVPLARAAWSAWTNRPYATAPVTPYFWGGEPNDLAFEKPTPDATLRQRHHVRIWRTPYLLPDGARVFVGAASFDDGFDPGLFHHIDPNIDAERDTLAADLAGAGAAIRAPLAVSQPRLGTSVAGDPWFTDGAATVLVLD